MKEKLIENKRYTIKYINISFSVMDRTSRQKIREMEGLNNTINQIDLKEIYKIFHPAIIEYILFSCALGIVSRKNHTLHQ
jgi:hypothetical protein